MKAMPTYSQISWRMAMSGAKRVTKAMPMPDSAYANGRIAGSAPGANLRTARCDMANATKMPMGVPSVSTVGVPPLFTMSMANGRMTIGVATSNRISSILRLDITHHP